MIIFRYSNPHLRDNLAYMKIELINEPSVNFLNLKFIVFFTFAISIFNMMPANAICEDLSQTDIKKIEKSLGNIQDLRSKAIAHVHTEGTLPHQGIYDESILAEKDWQKMREVALLWCATHKQDYVVALSRLMQGWAEIYRPNFNPIDETNLDAFIEAYNLAHDALTPSARIKSQRLIRIMTEGYLKQMEYRHSSNDSRWSNNWNSHRVKLVVMGAGALNDSKLWEKAKIQFIDQVNRNINPDGSTLDFDERDALHYVVYDLTPLLAAAIIAQSKGESWLFYKTKNGSSLEKAVNWLLPYALGKKTHLEFINTRVKFDIVRKNAGLMGYSGVWNPHEAAELFKLASSLDKKYASVPKKIDSNGKYTHDTSSCRSMSPGQ